MNELWFVYLAKEWQFKLGNRLKTTDLEIKIEFYEIL